MARMFARFRHFLVTLRFSILSIFITLFVIAILGLITINYMRYSKSMLTIASDMMEKASNELYRNFRIEVTGAEGDDKASARLIQLGILKPNHIDEMVEYITDLLSKTNLTQQIFWCNELGDCISASYESDDSITTDLIFNSKKPKVREFLYHDPKGRLIKKVSLKNFDYDPRSRPWYIQAKNEKQMIWTDVYPYKEKPFLGSTVATPVYKKNGDFWGVFGMDQRLDWLSWYVHQLSVSKNSVIFIVNKSGDLIAFPGVYESKKEALKFVNIHSIEKPWVSKSFDIFKKTGKEFFSFEEGGQTYLANYQVYKEYILQDWMIGIVLPEDDFTGALKKASLIDVQTGLLILLLGILLVSAIISRIVRPIKKLVKQTEKIKHFDLSEQERIRSRIKEVMLLSNAIYAMRMSLKSFQKYVPATLVRRLIKAGKDVKSGGVKTPLTILFTDIKNFTTIAENMDPSELLDLMCTYFEELSKIIVAEKGTIDKYIGDSIMAFWGAPLRVKHPCHAAARAALSCIRRLQELDIQWKSQDKPLLITRIGIHIGDVVVGNVGSSERLNYTAIGDAINLASRLEGLNKIYGTSIIVSDAVYQIIKQDFVLRKIDIVALKGKIGITTIYELLAEKKNEIHFDVEGYSRRFEEGFAAYQEQNWDAAIGKFEECLRIYPEDSVAAVFIKRCLHFKLKPPLRWDGIWHMKQK